MVAHRGPNRGSYIWGRSIHNTRIERLWVDVTNAFGRKWSEFFYTLETNHGMNPLNEDHIWLLHWLFLEDMNRDAVNFQNEWNFHTLALREGNQRPVVLFLVGCLQLGARGITLRMEDDEDYFRDPNGFGLPFNPDDNPISGFDAIRGTQSLNGDAVPQRLNTIDSPPLRCPITPREQRILARGLEGYLTASDWIMLTERWRRACEICASLLRQR
ncbi:hypothetical protein CALVIDRAFT_544040 [Calocera viscosa TUFC12733]|uniref:Integrase core domain-containing protein n=1 Tax=Calocera viscosa (strain TUFC12733) TaxID=1330018 RepID=A0A167RJT1_CALVF|nr:hypothetical protein CALVIDRAFT_544040 [Calocera viscosa TUFC12733]